MCAREDVRQRVKMMGSLDKEKSEPHGEWERDNATMDRQKLSMSEEDKEDIIISKPAWEGVSNNDNNNKRGALSSVTKVEDNKEEDPSGPRVGCSSCLSMWS